MRRAIATVRTAAVRRPAVAVAARPCCRFINSTPLAPNAAAGSSDQPAKHSKPEKAALDFTTAGRPKGGKLAKIIRDSIKITGPIPISRYMQFCLSHPTEGYYSQGDVFGRKGDFVTSPEISQVFGELVAIWLLTRWMAAGSPKKSRLVELGPGRGTLMDDVLRTLKTFPACFQSLTSVHLVDNSIKMQELQKEKLEPRIAGSEISLNWGDRLEDIEPTDEFTMLVAHEFFDAMPINLFEKTAEGFREVFVGLDQAFDPSLPTPTSPSGLHLTLSPTPTTLSKLLPESSPRFNALPVGSRVEISQDSYKIARQIGELVGSSAGGAGLVVDYGGDQSYGASFRAFKHHAIVDIFDAPGTADLTANVDFAYLREAVGDLATVHGPIAQRDFLESLGLQPRLMALLASATPERRKEIESGAKRLVDLTGMGQQYQVMGIIGGAVEEEVYPFPARTATQEPAAELKESEDTQSS